MKASQSVLFRAPLILSLALLLFSFKVSAQLQADFSATPVSGCAPLFVTFQDLSTGNPTAWQWDLGNGTISSSSAPSTTYFDPGVYTVTLTVSDGSQSDTKTKIAFITVYANPAPAFDVLNTTGCFPLEAIFTDMSVPGAGTIQNITWDFGDGNLSNEQNPSHTYLSAGLFDVTLSLTNSFGCSATLTKSDLIDIAHGVKADFDIVSVDACNSPAKVVFENESTGDANVQYSWDFGDGNTSTDFEPEHWYASQGGYQVLLKAESIFGCTDTISKTVNISLPHSSFDAPGIICANKQIQFINTSSPEPVSVTWVFGDGTTSNDFNPLKKFEDTGTYKIKLINKFAAQCVDSIIKTVSVISGPGASFTTNDTSSCSAPYTVKFQNTTTGAAVSYEWDFGDGKKSTEENPSHVYTDLGSYDVKLKAINSNGCEDVFIISNCVVIQPVKITKFTSLPDSGCIPFTVKPAAVLNIPANVTSYSWDFGDGSTSSAANPSHTYITEGAFSIKLTITTAEGCTDSYTMNNAVLAGHKPNADFTYDKTEVCSSEPVRFTDASTNGPIHYLEWFFGDMMASSHNSTILHEFNDTGYVTVSLVAYNFGCADSITKKHIIYIRPPVAKLNVQTNCEEKLRVNFGDSSLDDKKWTWEFGDGTTSTVKNPVHTYSSAGTYNIRLLVENSSCYDTAYATVRLIDEHGIAEISDSVVCKNTDILLKINNVNQDNIARTVWRLGNGETIVVNNGTNATAKYTTTGTYNISAVMTDLNGCKDTLYAKHSIKVYGPTAKFYNVEPGACLNSTIHFTDVSLTDGIHPINSWTWNFGDDAVITFFSPPFSHAYTDTGIYDIKLIVKDSYGCTDSLKKNNLVHITQPYASFSVSDSVVCPAKRISFTNETEGTGLQYLWDFNDGTQSNDDNPYHQYASKGAYHPKLFVTDINNCRDTAVLSEAVFVTLPHVKFNMSDSFSTCPPLSVNFTNESNYYKNITWNFGDGSTSVLDTPAHIYTYPGVYSAKLIAQGNGNCFDSLVKIITVKGPTGIMQYDKTPLCFPAVSKLKAVAQNTVQYLWDFSDGHTQTTNADSVEYTYLPGAYLPKLILSDATGCKVPVKGIDTIKVFDVTAHANVSNSVLCDSGKIVFKDSSVSNDAVTKRTWYFDDGTSSNEKIATHYFSSSGAHQVKLVPFTKHGCSDTLLLNNTVKVERSPDINILGDTAACQFSLVAFGGNNNTQDTSGILWQWNFGNGDTATGQKPQGVKFSAPGNYVVTLRATSSGGCTDSTAQNILIHAAPKVDAGFDTVICKAQSYTLTPSGGITYLWNSNAYLSCFDCANPVATPDSTDTFVVTGKDANGCTAADTIIVAVKQPISVNTSNNDSLCIGQSLRLSASGAEIYQWSPPVYLDNPSLQQPVFTAAKDTTITYRVTGTDSKKCFSDTSTVTLKIFPLPHMQILQKEVTVNVGATVKLETASSPDVTKWRWEPPLYLDNPNIASPVATPRSSVTYTCIAGNDGGCIARAQVSVHIICNNSNIFIPNTFSPNKDGVNDRFFPRGNGLFNIKSFRVFNRWGQLVFAANNIAPNDAGTGWDGTFNKQQLPSDVYVYMIEVMCDNNNIVPLKGNIILLR